MLSAARGFTTAFSYNPTGHLSALRNTSGELVRTTTDTDGREQRSQLLEAAASSAHSFVLWERDAFMRPTFVRRFAGVTTDQDRDHFHRDHQGPRDQGKARSADLSLLIR